MDEMSRCEKCGQGALELSVVPEYQATRLGIPGVIVRDAVLVRRCDACGSVAETTIPNLAGLVAAVALVRIKRPTKLAGEEIRFLRRAMQWTGRECAQRLEVSPETVSKWEHNHNPIGPTSEKLLRLLVGLRMKQFSPAIDFDSNEIESMEISGYIAANASAAPEPIVLHLVPRDEPTDDAGHDDDGKKLWAVG